MNEVKKSFKSGYYEDVLLKVDFLDSGKKITGKNGKVLCSKEYNNYISSAITGLSGSRGNVDYGRIVSQGIRYVVIALQKDLEYGIKDNDYILEKNKENLMKYINDVDKCGGKCYNLLKMVYELAWFVGGDVDKITRLQKTLNKQGYSKVIQDGVYGPETEEAWINYVNRTLDKYTRYDDVNVWGRSVSISGHFFVGVTAGLAVYIDDDFNILIMGNGEVGTTSDIEVSISDTYEWSRTAGTAYDMAGKSINYGAGIGTPIYRVGVNGGHSRAFGDSGVTSNSVSGTIGASLTVTPISVSYGVSANKILIDFNPKEWIRKRLKV